MPFFNHDGLTIFYTENGQGFPLVLIPGSTTAAPHYKRDMERLAGKGHRVICFDWPGTGRSQRLERWSPRWLDDVAGCVIALLDYLNLPEAVLVGSSGGAMAALLTALKAPERVSAVIADSTGESWSPGFIHSVVNGRRENLELMGDFWQIGHGDDWRQVVEKDNQALLQFAHRGDDWLRGRLVQLNLPVLFCGSLQDELIPDIGGQIQSMACQIPGSRVFLTHNGGHPLMWSYPDLFYEQVDSFLTHVMEQELAVPVC